MGQLDSTCRAPTLTPPDPQLKGARCPGGFNPRAFHAKTRFQSLGFQNAACRCCYSLEQKPGFLLLYLAAVGAVYKSNAVDPYD
jgi:hypothetical protein